MAGLPKINKPVHKHYLKGLGQEVEFRPFTVAEQKILLLAKEEEDKKQILTSIEQILNNCIVTEGVDVLDLPYFDIEDIFIRIRAKSVGEVIESKYVYDYVDEEGNDKQDEIIVKINTDDIQVEGGDQDNKIILQDNPIVGIKMKYPTLKMYKEMEDIEQEDEIIFRCVECIFDDETTYTDIDKKDFDEFIDSLDALSFNKVQEFFNSMPSIHHEITINLPKKGEDVTLTFNNLADFFF